ncbi:MAG: hypothetical protein OXR73_29370, partial [Myxococcales bacterium]|nr:hypothetical protein [Myxococcales bacterium]
VFRVPDSSFASGRAVAEPGGELHLGLVTAADITPDGRLIIVRTYTDAWLWQRQPGMDVVEALQTPACELPLSIERQGESIAWAHDGSGYYTISEGLGETLYFYPRLP